VDECDKYWVANTVTYVGCEPEEVGPNLINHRSTEGLTEVTSIMARVPHSNNIPHLISEEASSLSLTGGGCGQTHQLIEPEPLSRQFKYLPPFCDPCSSICDTTL
jgi:hypothetical protein